MGEIHVRTITERFLHNLSRENEMKIYIVHYTTLTGESVIIGAFSTKDSAINAAKQAGLFEVAWYTTEVILQE